MSLDRRRIGLFALQFLPLFLALSAAYAWIRPPYEKLVVASSNALLGTLTPSTRIDLQADGRWRVHLDRPELTASFGIGSEDHGLILFLNLILLPPLLLATPVPLAERLRLAGVGIVLLYLMHLLTVCGCVYVMGVLNDPGNFLFRTLPKALRLGAQGITVALWGLLAWRYWLPRPAGDRVAAR
jgi:hypothetical protein